MDGLTILSCDHLHRTGIDIAASCSHKQPLQRSQTHRGIHAFPILDSRNRCAVAQMADNELCRIIGHSQHIRSPMGYIVMARAMETVSSDTILLVIPVWYRI